jgi:hypothetical protein
MGQGIRKDKCIYLGPQVEAKYNAHHRVHQRGIGYEETVGRTHHYANAEKGSSG